MYEEYDPFEISSFTEDLLNVFINHGYGDMKMYESTCFMTHLKIHVTPKIEASAF